jgi:hypothetical protein
MEPNFQKKFKQKIKIAFSNKNFQKLIIAIRSQLDIPPNGFNFRKQKKEIYKWLQEKGGKWGDDFKEISKILKKYPSIKTDPGSLLQCIADNPDFDFNYYKDCFILDSPLIDIYYNHINEKPFPGIFEYIFFGEIFIPQTNFFSFFEAWPSRDIDVPISGFNYITIALSPNTTKRDFIRYWTFINSLQKGLRGYAKNKIRMKKNLNKYLQLQKNDSCDIEDIFPDEFSQANDPPKKIYQKRIASKRKMKQRSKRLLGSK